MGEADPGAPDKVRLTVFLNPSSGSADEVRRALEGDARFAPREVEPSRLGDEIRRAAGEGARRVAVAGGDGTVALAASAASQVGVELAVVPGGTLNHFARHLGIPLEVPAALDLAVGGEARAVSAASVNGRLFLNTSSLGAYVDFVRKRDRRQPLVGYGVASLAALAETLGSLPRLELEAELNGEVLHFDTPIFFVGVGERALAPLRGGERTEKGWQGLHVLVVESGLTAELLLRALAASRGGVEEVERLPEVDGFQVDRCTVRMAEPRVSVAADGEVFELDTPLEYLSLREAVRVVAP